MNGPVWWCENRQVLESRASLNTATRRGFLKQLVLASPLIKEHCEVEANEDLGL